MKQWWANLTEKPLKNGTLLQNQFCILEVIGKGSYGLTYKALNVNNKLFVVVKQLRNRKRKSKEELDFFQQEALFLQKLQHPAIPQFIQSFDKNGCPFLVMEYIEAATFEELIFKQNKQYGEKEAFAILLKVISVVSYIHQMGIVHRDLRIPNILWDGQKIYIIDFGLARYLSDKKSALVPKNKKDRMAFRDISVESDFFALGQFVLFLLYSAYEPVSKKELSWEEELMISQEAKIVIRKMLQLDCPFKTAVELDQAVRCLIKQQ